MEKNGIDEKGAPCKKQNNKIRNVYNPDNFFDLSYVSLTSWRLENWYRCTESSTIEKEMRFHKNILTEPTA